MADRVTFLNTSRINPRRTLPPHAGERYSGLMSFHIMKGNPMRTWLPLVAALLAGLATLPAQAENVYRWVDDDGVTHFTAHPPKNRQSDQLRTQTGHSEPVDYSKQYPAEEAQNQERANSQNQGPSQAELDDACQRARENLRTLEQGGRIAEEAEDGSRRYLSEEEKAERAERARQTVEETC